jgi:hypothetical protein
MNPPQGLIPPAQLQHALDRIPRRMGLDATPIYRGLHQGMAPPAGPLLSSSGFDTIVLCAEEWQPPRFVDPVCGAVLGYLPNTHPYPGTTLVYAPADDDFYNPPSRERLSLALRASAYVAQRVAQGSNVLVTCWAGKNRSGLVTGLALHRLTGLPGHMCVAHIKKVRPIALMNPQFVAVLNRLQGTPPPGVPRAA